MKARKIDLVRVIAILFIILWIAYFYLNIYSPTSIPKSLRIGIIRKPVNILILGTDITYDAVTRKPMPKHRGRADTILLCRIDPIKWQLNILSIPRDTYLAIPGRDKQRINVANVYGGPNLVKRSVSDLTQQKIDYYIKIKPAAATKLVDLLGGVYVDVEENMQYVDRAQNLYIDLKKGYQKLSGKDAHDYIRYRDKFRGDIGRIERQQKFFKALGKALTSPANIFRAPHAVRSALQEIETDIPLDLTIRILNMARMVTAESIKTATLPGEVSFVKGVGSVWLPDKAELKKTIEEFL